MSSWAKRIRQLQKSGMTLSEIAAQVGLAVSSVSDIANGRSASPRGEGALKLDRLHRERCGAMADDVA